jgi:hypothetical protein
MARQHDVSCLTNKVSDGVNNGNVQVPVINDSLAEDIEQLLSPPPPSFGAHTCNRPDCNAVQFSSLSLLSAHMKSQHGEDVVEAMIDSFFDSDSD